MSGNAEKVHDTPVLDSFLNLMRQKCSSDDFEVIDVAGVSVLSLKTDVAFQAAQDMFVDFDSGNVPEGWSNDQQVRVAKLDNKGRLEVRDCYEIRIFDSETCFYFLKEENLAQLKKVGSKKKTARMESLLANWFQKNAHMDGLTEQRDAERALLGDYSFIVNVLAGLKPAAAYKMREHNQAAIKFFISLVDHFDEIEMYPYGENEYIFYNPEAIKAKISQHADIFTQSGIDSSTSVDSLVKDLVVVGDTYDQQQFGTDAMKALALLLGYDLGSVEAFPDCKNSPEFDFNIWGEQYVVHDPENNEHFKALKDRYDQMQAQIEDLLARGMSPMEVLKSLVNLADARIGTREAVGDVFELVEDVDVIEQIRAAKKPLAYLAQKYDYKPYPSTVQPKALGIDWDSLDSSQFVDEFENYDDIDKTDARAQYRAVPVAEFWDVEMHVQSLDNMSGQKLSMKTTKSMRRGRADGVESSTFAVHLDSEAEPDLNRLNFTYAKEGEFDVWYLNDRSTLEPYTGQGLASNALKLAEACVAKRPDKNMIKANVGQADVLCWMLRAGYDPATDEDKRNIERLFKIDPNLTIVSAPGDENAEFKRQWYMFDSTNGADPSNSEIWDDANRARDDYYMKSSFRIDLKKEF